MRARYLLAQVIATLPLNRLRVFAYRRFFGYRILQARIGWRCVIEVDDAELVGCTITAHNVFRGPMSLRVGRGALILNDNVFGAARWTLTAPPSWGVYARRLEIGEDTLITSHHLFDVAGTIVIGRGSRIAGSGSQFWTHGPGDRDRSIRIGEDCYVGSRSIFGPGAALSDRTMVAIGSLVARRFPRRNVLIGGVPAETLRENFDWKTWQDVGQANRPEDG